MITHEMVINQGENGIKKILLSEFDNKVTISIGDVDKPLSESDSAYVQLNKKELHDFIGTLLYCQNKLNKSK